MIVVTGAAGFIGSNMIAKLNQEGFNDIVIVDDFQSQEKKHNLDGKKYTQQVHRDSFFDWIDQEHRFIQIIIHIGARTDTTEFDTSIFDQLNLNYTKTIWEKCTKFGLPFIYASSAATYGMGEYGYEDRHDIIPFLKPLNPYGESKNNFDIWALQQSNQPYFWAGLKFFNVYGPNEYHKGRMSSVIFNAFKQIRDKGHMNLFKSHHPDYQDGEQKRDFIYVKDVVDIILFLIHQRKYSGIYNVGTGKARTFIDLTRNTFAALGKKEKIGFIDTPADIRNKYQYFTEATIDKLRNIGYTKPFHSLEEGINDYVKNYLITNRYI